MIESVIELTREDKHETKRLLILLLLNIITSSICHDYFFKNVNGVLVIGVTNGTDVACSNSHRHFVFISHKLRKVYVSSPMGKIRDHKRVSYVSGQSRRTTSMNSKKIDSLNHLNVVLNLTLVTPMTKPVQRFFNFCFSLDNVSGMEREDLMHEHIWFPRSTQIKM